MSAAEPRRLVLVVGVGRSGTSLLAGILGQLGFHIPQPEVTADDTNPRGFGEPRWVVDFHRRLMAGRRITVFDARPAAWDATATATDDPAVVEELRAWLGAELAQSADVVVKDPRSGWFLPLWNRCAADLGAQTSFITMLRHPAEILTSAKRSYGEWQTDASRAASWLNVMLQTEQATRDTRRAFIRYEDLLADWQAEVSRAGAALELPLLTAIDDARRTQVDRFVDPGLHRARVRWDDLAVPGRVIELCEAVWEQLQPLARPADDTAAVFARLDASHAAYDELYAEAESIAQSSVTAVRPKKKPARGPAAPPTLKVRVARRIPARYRRRLRGIIRGSGS